MSVVRGVRALDVTNLALPAQLGRPGERLRVELLGAGSPALFDGPIDAREDVWKRSAVAYAHATAVADFEYTAHLDLEIACVPVTNLVRVERRRLGGNWIDLGH